MSCITAYSVSVLAGQTGAVRLQCGNSQIPCYIKDCMLLYSHFTTEEEKEWCVIELQFLSKVKGIQKVKKNKGLTKRISKT